MKPRGGFDPDRAREAGRRGGLAKAAKLRAARGHVDPFSGTILDALEAAGLVGPSWASWRAFWRAVFALPMDDAELRVFRTHTGRSTPSSSPVREAWQVVGRRGGKSRNAAVAAMYLGVRRNYHELLAPGERAVIPVIAADRKQAGAVFGYIKGLAKTEPFERFVARVLKESVELRTGVAIEVHSASYRTTRGYTVCSLVADEIAFWRSDDTGANPDAEVLGALRPGMATVSGALLLGLSTPYAPRGELFRVFERYHGRDEADVLVWQAASLEMNPQLDAGVVARAYEDDAVAAAAEYGAEFRRDVEAFLDVEAVRAVTIPGRYELEPQRSVAYVAFVDPSGGSQDSFTLAIAHHSEGRAVLDLVREVRPPFSPDQVVAEFATVLRMYGIERVRGDRYAGEWARERFRTYGVGYEPAEQTKSELYKALLPIVNAGRCELLDLPRLAGQLEGLERRVARGGRDSVDHVPGAHDDVANAAAGALVLAAPVRQPLLFLSDVDLPDSGDSDIGFDADEIQKLPGRAWFPGDPLPLRGGPVERDRLSGDLKPREPKAEEEP